MNRKDRIIEELEMKNQVLRNVIHSHVKDVNILITVVIPCAFVMGFVFGYWIS